jgi:hypothetical protein
LGRYGPHSSGASLEYSEESIVFENAGATRAQHATKIAASCMVPEASYDASGTRRLTNW